MTMKISTIAAVLRKLAAHLDSAPQAAPESDTRAAAMPAEFRPGEEVHLNADYEARIVGAEKSPETGKYPRERLAQGTVATVVRCGARGPASIQVGGNQYLVSRSCIRTQPVAAAPAATPEGDVEETPTPCSNQLV